MTALPQSQAWPTDAPRDITVQQIDAAEDALIREWKIHPFKQRTVAKMAVAEINDAIRDADFLDLFWQSSEDPLEAGFEAQRIMEWHRRAFVVSNLERIERELMQ